MAIWQLEKGQLQTYDPVSYTHLDVYKRQALRSSDLNTLADFGNKNSCFCSAIVGAMVFFSIIRVFLNFLGTETACLSRCSNPTRRVLYAIIAI